MQDSRVRRGSTSQQKKTFVNSTSSSFRVSKRPPRLVYHHSLVLKKTSAPRASLSSDTALKIGRKSRTWRQSVHKIHIACCFCFAHCCHDPIIMRSASNLSTVFWFQSVCASLSMFTINTDNCRVLFMCTYRGSVFMSKLDMCTFFFLPFTKSMGFVTFHLVVVCAIHGCMFQHLRNSFPS